MKRLIYAFATIVFLAATYQAAGIVSSGNWNVSIDASDLIAGAGSNLANAFESLSGVTTLDISVEPGPWRLLARRSDTNWNGTTALFMKRTSDGTGIGTISGGASYVEITSVDTDIFSGSGDRTNITVQYKLTGMSLHVSPNLYSTSIIFTVVQ